MTTDDNDSRVPLLSDLEADRHSDEYGTTGHNKSSAETTTDHHEASGDEDDDVPESTDDVHGGVKQADAINLVWSRNALILAYFL